MEPDVRRMFLLADVAAHGSITATARALNYTPSAVSQQLAKLEDEAGQPLLERQSRGISLTIAGEAVVRHATRIRQQIRATRAELDEIAGLRAGRLFLGTFPTAGSSLLPPAVTRFRELHPEVRLTVRSGLLAGLRHMLENRTIELALLWDYEWNRLDDDGLQVRHLLDDQAALVVGRHHWAARRTSIDLSALAGEPWITRAENNPVAEVLARSCRAAGFEPQIVYEAHDYQEAQAMVGVGLGVAVAPRLALTNPRDDVAIVPIRGYAPIRRILLARLAERRPTPAENAITAVFEEVATTFARPTHG
ncbi:LysR family transcriptional regulator [Saccharopolyspora rosea]|uniref:LysR family transcriptional regulator n=1 Tax=Saccharopolyspora rosea TaxID=524884 RepID=A0ABW3G2N1_9PSEU|nr:LysR family transcriptional regulator [Saccharopolyspora rosea]